MKVCLSFLTYAENVFGGIENSIYNLAKGFADNNVNVVIYTSKILANNSQDKVNDKIKIFRSNILPGQLPIGNDNVDRFLLSFLKDHKNEITNEISSLILEENIDLAIAFDLLWGILHVAESVEKLTVPVILSLHVVNTRNLLIEASRTSYLFTRIVSQDLQERVNRVSPLTNLRIIPNSIDTKVFYPAQTNFHRSNIIFCNSRINPDKGVIHLVHAFSELIKSEPRFKLLLCSGKSPFGDFDKEIPIIEGAIKKLDLTGSVELLSNLKWSKVPEMIRKSFAVVLPTYYESFGRAALETLSCGVPLIASKVGNIPELVKDAAILVSPRSDIEILNALKSLITHPSFYKKLSDSGPILAEKYSNKLIAKEFITLFYQYIN